MAQAKFTPGNDYIEVARGHLNSVFGIALTQMIDEMTTQLNKTYDIEMRDAKAIAAGWVRNAASFYASTSR